jgi:hypothetical protein
MTALHKMGGFEGTWLITILELAHKDLYQRHILYNAGILYSHSSLSINTEAGGRAAVGLILRLTAPVQWSGIPQEIPCLR